MVMEETITDAVHQLEDSLDEIKIMLRMSDTNLYNFTAYREGKVEKPPYLNPWVEDGVLGEFENIIETINNLIEVKEELSRYLGERKAA